MTENTTEVVWAKLHTSLFVPSVDGKPTGGNYKETLTADATGPDRNMKMYLTDTMLLVHTKGVVVAVPLANVSSMVLKKV